MPPIDPAVLRQRTSALIALLDDPPRLAAGVRRLLDDYADRTYRASPRVVTSARNNRLRVPGPVLRAIVTALREPLRAEPEKGLAVLDRLWAGGAREERRIAAELLGLVLLAQPAEGLARVEAWVMQIESGETADALAELGLGPLALQDPLAHLEYARRWVTHPQRWARRFGLALFWPLLKDKQWDNVPGALAVIRPVMTEPDGEVRRAVAAVLEHMAPKSPAEVSRFLLEQAYRSNTHTRWIVRNALASLGAAEQAEIVKALRT
jgi:3-methyladenine DNA glycosylase AlkD